MCRLDLLSSIRTLTFRTVDLIARRLQLAGFKLVRLQGNMAPEARDRTIKYFTETTDCTVFLLSLKAGGVALNLTVASNVYLMDPWVRRYRSRPMFCRLNGAQWNPSVEVQAMDRMRAPSSYSRSHS